MPQSNATVSLKTDPSRADQDETPVCEFFSFTVCDDPVRVAGALARAGRDSSCDCGLEAVRNAIQGRTACPEGDRHAD